MKSFDEIYNKIQETLREAMEEKRKAIKNRGIKTMLLMFFFVAIIIAGVILTAIIGKATVLVGISFPILLIFFLIFIFFSLKKTDYVKTFKENIIKKFIKEYDKNLEYNPLFEDMSNSLKVPIQMYGEGEFERYDSFGAEDYIHGTLNEKYKINMFEVLTQNASSDGNGDTEYVTVFHGLFAKVEFGKFVNTDIQIRKNSKKTSIRKDKIEMDSSEFEKIFDVYADNKIIAMQLLTSDTMQMLLDFKEKNKLTPEITLKDNTLYIRFATGDMFEPNIFKNSLDYYTLERYYDTINFTLGITEKFLKNVEETEI